MRRTRRRILRLGLLSPVLGAATTYAVSWVAMNGDDLSWYGTARFTYCEADRGAWRLVEYHGKALDCISADPWRLGSETGAERSLPSDSVSLPDWSTLGRNPKEVLVRCGLRSASELLYEER